MFKNGVLTIDYDTWKGGIAASPLVGCGMLRNAEIVTKRGALICGSKAVNETGDLLEAFVRFMAHDESNNRVLAADETGLLYRRAGDGSWSAEENSGFNWSEAADCQGLAFWKGNLLFADDLKLHVYDVGNYWYADVAEFAEGRRNLIRLPHVIHVGQDDVAYITDGRYIASLQEIAGQTFDPDDSNTFTWNAAALDLPEGYVASTLSELGTYLVIGTYYSEVLNRGNRAELFPWDRISPSFGIPQRTKGNGVWQTIAEGNILYSLVDRRNGKVYASNLTTFELQRELRTIADELSLHPDAVEALENELLFGIGSDEPGTENCGVYSFSDGAMTLRNVLSGGDSAVEIGSLLNVGEGQFLASWTDGTNHAVDVISDVRYDSYATVLESPVFTVGTALQPTAFTQVDINLAKKLSAGQGVRVKYREHLDDDWTLVGTFDYATFGAVAHMNTEAGTGDVTTIQLRIELTTLPGSTDSPELLSVSLF